MFLLDVYNSEPFLIFHELWNWRMLNIRAEVVVRLCLLKKLSLFGSLRVLSDDNNKTDHNLSKEYWLIIRKFSTSHRLEYSSFNNMVNNCNTNDDSTNEGEFQNLNSNPSNLESSTLKNIFLDRGRNISSLITEKKVKSLCGLYRCLPEIRKKSFILELAGNHAVDHNQVYQAAKSLLEMTGERSMKITKTEDQLRNLLTPQYSWLFCNISKLENGVKFLVDLRTDVLNLIAEKNANSEPVHELHTLNTVLRELLSLWFSVGFLELERVTWKSPCEILEKISLYEAVHPIGNWTDLKRRVGPYRRCFIFVHRSMPGEPIVVLHTALLGYIPCSLKDIVLDRPRSDVVGVDVEDTFHHSEEDPKKIKAAIFYSIASTQKGLQGIELGNYLIKRVAGELKNEFPQITMFSSLSPIPTFRMWLLEKINNAKKGHNDILFEDESEILKTHFNSPEIFDELRRILLSDTWYEDARISSIIERPLMRLCARYLYLEKRRGYALDSVANFHLKNGAIMWRINWRANLLPRGLSTSCGIMVNYRYFLEETESNSISYLERKQIFASEQIMNLAQESEKLFPNTKKSNL